MKLQGLYIFYLQNQIKGGISRLAKSRKPQFTAVNEDLRDKRNAEITLFADLPFLLILDYLFRAVATSTAQATVHPTIGLLPIPRNPIISTWAGTEDEPANCASLCIRPMVSVMP